MEQHNIGIALSGGVIRAMIFHLGLFMAANKLLEQVKRVSSVSGACLCVGQMLLRHGYEVADCTYHCYQQQNREDEQIGSDIYLLSLG